MSDDDDEGMEVVIDQLAQIIDALADLQDHFANQSADIAALKASVDELSGDMTMLLAGG